MSSRYTLKDLRKVNRLSIEQLSEKTGVDVETLTALEIDSSDISFEVMKKLSRFYCIAANYIFLGEQSEIRSRTARQSDTTCSTLKKNFRVRNCRT